MPSHDEAGILHSWHHNADAWARSVRDKLIESRRLVTDQAILGAILALRPRSVLDVGCGEGWLVHALAARGV
jgi:2-polyprenyl-3-methyl-5-hydroxy-6-metoxy-1,4-benzoquinol methylase